MTKQPLTSEVCKALVEQTVAGFGRIDVLINNAGGLIQRVPVEAITDDLVDQVLNALIK